MSALAGVLQLAPGAPVPHALRSTRQAWAAQLAPDRPAGAWPGLVSGLFSLCGQAHRLASQLAIQAAEPGACPAPGPVAVLLQRETALEHLRRIALDWPRLLAGPDASAGVAGVAGVGAEGAEGAVATQAADSLRHCPLIAAPAQPDPWPALRHWLQHAWLQSPPADWLRAWQDGGAEWLQGWCQGRPGWLPRLLREARAADTALPRAHASALRPHGDEASLQALGAALAAGDIHALQPRWQGRAAGTGPWTRLHLGPPDRPWTAWSLLGSRLAELVRLSLPDAAGQAGAGWLAWGARATGPREGLAWVEMARGLLIHQVSLAPASPGVPARLRAAQVIAPTDWNFHPEGLAARALADLPPGRPGLAARVGLLMAALDPCVPFEIAAPPAPPVHLPPERRHA